MQRRCGGRELDDHAEAGDLAVALEARPDDRAVEKDGPDAWATAGPRGDPLLALRRDGVEFVGSSGKPTAGMCRRRPSRSEMAMASWMTKALGFRREVGHVATSGLAGVPGNIAREGFAVPPKPHPNSVSAVFPKLPPRRFQKDAWRHREDCVG